MKLTMSFLGCLWLSLLSLGACSSPDQNLKSSNTKPQPTQPSKPKSSPGDTRLPLVCKTGRASPQTLVNSKQVWGESREVATAFVGQKPDPNFIENSGYLPLQWKALSPQTTALVVCIIESMKSKLLESCSYTGSGKSQPFKVNRYRSELEVRLLESKTGKQLAETTFVREAKLCPEGIYFPPTTGTTNSEDRFVESPVSEFQQEIETWLKPYLQ